MNATKEESAEETRGRKWTALEKSVETLALPLRPATSNADFCFDVMRQVAKDFVLIAATVLALQYLTGGISVAFIAK